MIPRGTTPETRQRFKRMLDPTRTDLLPRYPQSQPAERSSSPPPEIPPVRRRCRHLSANAIEETPANCCGSPLILVYHCELLSIACVPHQQKAPRDQSIRWCRLCDAHVPAA